MLTFVLTHHDAHDAQARLANDIAALTSAQRFVANLILLLQPPQARRQEIIELEARLKVLRAA